MFYKVEFSIEELTLIGECKDLHSKIVKLEKELEENECVTLTVQLGHMKQYRAVLYARIGHFMRDKL